MKRALITIALLAIIASGAVGIASAQGELTLEGLAAQLQSLSRGLSSHNARIAAIETAIAPTAAPEATDENGDNLIWISFSNNSDGRLEVWAEAPFAVGPGEMGILFYSSKVLRIDGVGTGTGYALLGQNRFDSTGVTQPGEKISAFGGDGQAPVQFLAVDPTPWSSEAEIRAEDHFLHTNITHVMAFQTEIETGYLCDLWNSKPENSLFVCSLCEMQLGDCLLRYQADWDSDAIITPVPTPTPSVADCDASAMTVFKVKDVSAGNARRFQLLISMGSGCDETDALAFASVHSILMTTGTVPFHVLFYDFLCDSNLDSGMLDVAFEYVPYGELSRATEVTLGDYSKHELKLVAPGFRLPCP